MSRASGALPPAGLGMDANRPIRKASITAGVGLLLMTALAGFGIFVALEGLTTQGNAAQTVPKLLGVLLAIAGLGYVVDSLSAVLSQGSSTDVATFTGIGEFLFALWLVIWGRRITLSKSGRDDPSQPRRFHEDPAGVAQ
jgi:hypothetical protein